MEIERIKTKKMQAKGTEVVFLKKVKNEDIGRRKRMQFVSPVMISMRIIGRNSGFDT